jgi:signal transduction histidine kinase/DNA-binding response OmpR family regulator
MKVKPDSTYLIRSFLLVVGAIIVNIALGHFVQYVLHWPLFFDSIGTILVGALLGPLPGAATGVVSNIIWGFLLNDPSTIPYSLVSAFIGWSAGYAVSRGAFERFHRAALSGLLVGFGAAMISAPITAYLYGGVTGGGTDYLITYLTKTGTNLIQAATIQGLISDPLDKVLSFVIAWLLWKPLHPYFLPPSKLGSQVFTRLEGYSLAVFVSILCTLFAFVFLPAFERGTLHIFYVAVLISAWRGGLGPAIFTTVVGALANLFFVVSPYYNAEITAEDWLRVCIFVIVSLLIAYIAYQLEQSRKHLQISLQLERESRARIRAIADGVNEALLLISNSQRILDANQRFVEIFGIPLGKITGQHLEDVQTLFQQIFAEADNLYEWVVTSSLDNAQEFTKIVVQNWPHHGELQLYSTPIRDEVGFLGRLFVFRDITHEREVDRMKTEFVSLVSHELRTPLTSIRGYTEMVLDGDAGEINNEVEEYLTVVLSNAERLVALVNDLLDISRIESGRIQLKVEAVDLKEIVETVTATMQQKLKEKLQDLLVEIDPTAVNVKGDKDKLVQVLTNYVSNAYKYTQAGGQINIQICRQGNFAHVSVKDNGFGISPEDQGRLFTRFYRVDNSMTREVGGTGLGLSIVKQLIELQGGEVGVQSAMGLGSTFWFTVPLAAETAESPVESTLAVPLPESEKPGASILVIEDDPDLANLITFHLQKAGYRVRAVATAEAALVEIEHEIPDLISLDNDLPGMHSDEFANRLHANPSWDDIPILVLSVLPGDQERIQFSAFILPKPVDQEELLGTVSQMLLEPRQGPLLVIDDDADVRMLLSTKLQKAGLRVETAPDGETGLVKAQAQHPSLILLDMHLPGMDGFSVLQALKNQRETADIPIIAMTGSPDLKTNARARFLALGASDFITKPFDMERLVKEIHIFINTQEV